METKIKSPSVAIILTIVFAIQKRVGIIDWEWYWIISPIWISILLILWIIALAKAPLPIKYIGICSTIIFLLVMLSKIL